jgi:hypothetical protein
MEYRQFANRFQHFITIHKIKCNYVLNKSGNNQDKNKLSVECDFWVPRAAETHHDAQKKEINQHVVGQFNA